MKNILAALFIAALPLVAGCAVDSQDDGVGTTESAIKPPPGGGCTALVTRTRGFWANHTCVLKGDATGYALVPVTIGASTTFDKPADVEAYLGQPAKGDKQLILGAQLLAAKLNVAAFGIGTKTFVDFDGDGKVDTVNALIAAADKAYDSGSDAERNKLAGILDKLNNAGDAEPLWFSPTCKAPPTTCKLPRAAAHDPTPSSPRGERGLVLCARVGGRGPLSWPGR